jgi:microcystin-dependent protein
MSQSFIGEIRMFGGNFAPSGWNFCNGQLLAISEYSALFNLIGTTYGGDGQQTFGLPNLQGRVPVHQGSNGMSTYVIGQFAGVEDVTLNTNQIPGHSHAAQVSTAAGAQPGPGANLLAASAATALYSHDAPNVSLNNGTVALAGGSQPHDNLQPFQCVSFIISLFGVYPTQS